MTTNVQQNISLKPFCTYQTGGNARFFAEAVTPEDMIFLRDFAQKEKVPFLLLGDGSNVLFADDGYPGLVIRNRMLKMHIQGDLVTAEGGVNLAKMTLIAAQHNLGGISGLATVPGTVGGAVYGNAGIPAVTISDVLISAVILPTNGNEPMVVQSDYFEFGYRDSKAKRTGDIILSATFRLTPRPSLAVRAEISQHIKERALKQPMGKTCGSFFKNPAEFPSAGWLIEQAGCKGMQVGGAVVSPKHANFIMNTGTATSEDILKLTVNIHSIVKKKFNVNMEPEVQIIPRSPFKKAL